MSSPYHSLRKKNKVPLFPGHMSGNRPIPFRHPEYTEDESRLLEEVTNNMVQEKLRRTPFNGLSTAFTSTPALSSPRRYLDDDDTEVEQPAPPSDSELMRLMMNRVAQLEQKAQTQSDEIKAKDRQIKILEDKLRIADKTRQDSQGGRATGAMRELETHCLLLQQQVHEMETFLAEYGMVWVGEETNDNTSVYLNEAEEDDVTNLTSISDVAASSIDPDGIWRQDTSLNGDNANANLNIDFNVLIENIKDLNVLAGDGTKPIVKTSDGARFEVQESVQLTIYANGIFMFDGPFRPYSDPMTRLWVKDILDGYFPSELQARYPDGVPFAVTDMRQTVFQPKAGHLAFTGEGQALGGETKPSRLIPSRYVEPTKTMGQTCQTDSSGYNVTSTHPGKVLSNAQFLNKLPQSIIKDGKVIDVRNSVGQVLTGSSGDGDASKPSVSVINTSVTKAMSDSVAALDDDTQQARPKSYKGHSDVTTLRVVTEAGDHTYIVKMKFSETVGNLRTYLDTQRRPAAPYDIVSTFPHMVHKNNSLTLEASGLTPNAVLHLKPCKD